ncbi:MAG: gamma-glutamyltransferase family protein [Oscillospiraceae bacterium]|nr:gamma-glutamyltransferase family protein [Oscillospiraceae bacterium]
MFYDPLHNPYPSRRAPVYAHKGMVCSSSPQASAAGIDAIRRGGNAMDAAVASAAAMTVVDPASNGIGSDAFALIWSERDRRLFGLNASGWSPRALTLEKAVGLAGGSGEMPSHGWLPTMVPGAPKAWAAVSERFGRLPLIDALAPAIDYARNGYPVAAGLARAWSGAVKRYSDILTGPEFREWFRVFAPDGKGPEPGQLVRLPDHARTLELIGESNARAFYDGGLTDAILRDSAEFGGLYDRSDFTEYDVTWVEPARISYRGYEVCEIPPNGQGIVALMALNILKEFSFPVREDARAFHLQWEAMKMAFADGLANITDPAHMDVDYRRFLDPGYGAARASEIGPIAANRQPVNMPKGGTVYFCAADGEGNMVSFIQSNYQGFGSGVVARGTGISLQNRGHDFSLDQSRPNRVGPRKKTYHTIIPGFLMKDGEPIGPFGVMGGYMQPQGHVQVVTNLIDYGMNPQQSLDAPRWQWTRDGRALIEQSFPNDIARQLASRGHRVEVSLYGLEFGRGQVILRVPGGTLVGGTEPRADGNIACI